jgi:hypothetical protein
VPWWSPATKLGTSIAEFYLMDDIYAQMYAQLPQLAAWQAKVKAACTDYTPPPPPPAPPAPPPPTSPGDKKADPWADALMAVKYLSIGVGIIAGAYTVGQIAGVVKVFKK